MRAAPNPKGLPAPPTDLGRASERSALFWGMHEHHDALERMWRKRRIDWVKFCAWAAENGWLTNAGAPIPATAKSTWQRVRTLIRRERAERKQARRPSHNPTAGQPRSGGEPVRTPEQARSRPSVEQAAPLQIDREVDAQLEHLSGHINRRSGRR